ncbi:MAG: hypothetical protein EZS28_020285, partial [Streblomastix strix]
MLLFSIRLYVQESN